MIFGKRNLRRWSIINCHQFTVEICREIYLRKRWKHVCSNSSALTSEVAAACQAWFSKALLKSSAFPNENKLVKILFRASWKTVWSRFVGNAPRRRPRDFRSIYRANHTRILVIDETALKIKTHRKTLFTQPWALSHESREGKRCEMHFKDLIFILNYSAWEQGVYIKEQWYHCSSVCVNTPAGGNVWIWSSNQIPRRTKRFCLCQQVQTANWTLKNLFPVKSLRRNILICDYFDSWAEN